MTLLITIFNILRIIFAIARTVVGILSIGSGAVKWAANTRRFG